MAPADRERLRADYLAELADLLWPGSRRAGKPYLVVPSRRRPRLLVPSDQPRAASRAVSLAGGGRSLKTRLVRTALAAALRFRLTWLFRDRIAITEAGLEAHLKDVMQDDVVMVVLVPAAKANRKPVLQLLDPAGRVLGYGKLSVDELTADLVRAETGNLTAIGAATIPDVTTPSVIHSGQWSGRELLVQSALPVPAVPDVVDPARLARAMEATALALGSHRAVLADSPYFAALGARVAAFPELAAVLEAVRAVHGARELTFGLWHGDWSPWNMAATPSGLLLWDWERMERDVPVGFDACHHRLQRGLARPARAREAVAELAGSAPEGDAVTALYLTHFAARYLADGQAEAGSRLGPVTEWLLPELSASLDRAAAVTAH